MKCALARRTGRMQKHRARMIGFGPSRILIAKLIRLATALTLAFFCITRMAGANVTATVDKPIAQLGETVTLSISFDGANVPQPNLPAIPNFQVVGTGS